MEYRVIVTPDATRSLRRIYDQIAEDSASAAIMVMERIEAATRTLDQFPFRHEVHRKIRDIEFRMLVVSGCVILYSISENVVWVHLYFKAGQDLDQLLHILFGE